MYTGNNDKSLTPPVEGDRVLPQEGFRTDNPLDSTRTSSEEDRIITLSRDAYESSKNWFDSGVRKQLERNLRAFNNQHPLGSKYYTEQYRKKSKIFRPKTRSAIRKQAAAAAIAFFSSSDVLHCSPVNDADERQQLAAELHMALIQFRLERPEMNWFLTVIGALIDASTSGVVCSRQTWRLRTAQRMVRETYVDAFGREYNQLVQEQQIKEDRPDCMLVPVENMRFDPACDWRDPVNTSPYVIELVPMYVGDIYKMQQQINPLTGRPHYRDTLSKGMVAAAIHQDWDSVRKAREGERLDKYDNDTEVRDHQSVWVHKHIMEIDGHDYVWDTLGTEILLSDQMMPLEEVYLTGRRPYVWGYCGVEPHKQYPAGTPELIDGLQEEANDIANLRLDNVKLSLNKRYYAKRGAGIDIRSLVRNVAGSVTFMNDVEAVKTVETRDVTASSYAEQDRLNLDMDDLIGDFSAGTVQANRQMNETVGGMKMLENNVNPLKEMTIRVFAETWYEPVLRQMIELESVYETDEVLLLTAGHKVGLENVDQTLQVIAEPIKVKVNVGFDATDPQKRVQRLAFGFATIGQFFPKAMMDADPAEAIKEVMGALGYKDGVRFFPALHRDQVPYREQMLAKRVQELEQMITTEQHKAAAKSQGRIQEIMAQGQIDSIRDQMKYEVQLILGRNKDNMQGAIAQMKDRLDQINAMLDAEETRIKRAELWLQREALSHEILEAERQWRAQMMGQSFPEGGAMNLPGEDKAGVISRDNYGKIPSMTG